MTATKSRTAAPPIPSINTLDDVALLAELQRVSAEHYGGILCILRDVHTFRVGFSVPESSSALSSLAFGSTFACAASMALQAHHVRSTLHSWCSERLKPEREYLLTSIHKRFAERYSDNPDLTAKITPTWLRSELPSWVVLSKKKTTKKTSTTKKTAKR